MHRIQCDMRILWLSFLLPLALAVNSCTQTPRREEPNAREAGRKAYWASQSLKRDAKDAAYQLHQAEEEFRQGWNEASREDNTRRQKATNR